MRYTKTLLASAVAAVVASSAPMADEPGGAGNNLSVPGIWAEGVSMVEPIATARFADTGSCKPVAALGQAVNPFEPEATPPCVFVEGAEGTYYWLQQREENRWEADTCDATEPVYDDGSEPWDCSGVVLVDTIDWGDNLEAVPWYLNSVVRVETVLYKDISGEPRLGYTMHRLWDQGPDEMHGASGLGPEATMTTQTEARIYTHCARLTIQKIGELPAEGEDVTLPIDGLVWDAASAEWIGAGGYPSLFNSSVYEGGEGPGYYSAEINVGGGVVYGYNWFVNKMNDEEGLYRLTFILDDACMNRNTYLDEGTSIAVPEEEDLAVAFSETDDDHGAPGGGRGAISVDDQLTYFDMYILPEKGSGNSNPGGNGSGGQGGQKGGGGHEEDHGSGLKGPNQGGRGDKGISH